MTDLDLMLKMQLPLTCEECGKELIRQGLHKMVCPRCGKEYRDDFQKIKDYLDENKGATIIEIERTLNIDRSVIRECLREGSLETTTKGLNLLSCDNCGRGINTGKYCQSCASARGTDIYGSAINKVSSIYSKQTVESGRMRFNSRFR